MCKIFSLGWLIFLILLKFSKCFILQRDLTFHSSAVNTICYRDIMTNRTPKHKNSFRPGKVQLVKTLKQHLADSKIVVQFRLTRLNHRLRSYIKENLLKHFEPRDGKLPYKMQLIKNTIMLRAVEGTEFEPLSSSLEKTNLYFFIYDDTIFPKFMSVVNGMRRASKIVKWRFEPHFGCFDHTLVDGNRLRCLSALPEKKELCSRIPHLLRMPLYKLINSVNVGQSLVNSLDQLQSKLNTNQSNN
ncbi:Ribosomal protein L10 family protein [Theileria parva strain Muguga]|uniref:Ribosomal protein L10 n=1 Tax=Theileria parva TaxID=5875 RepID=Q4N8Z7_THEPA|nr:Ribosomal protein L10 family protein [Theileria parva strain Muguga]EAN33561.1 Ribosomal protein L10 family protein [Theileria parva strain Muguga]|eukprot:XP_765844.1 hypothetical protein [Theileria parva strain Muguga]